MAREVLRRLYLTFLYYALLAQSVMMYVKYTFLNRFSRRSLSLPSGVIVSLTSFPARIEMVYLAIESAFHQSLSPGKVVLWLAREEMGSREIPESLKRLQRRGLEIRYIDDNLKSHNKLYYAALEYPGRAIVTMDDDIFYPRWWLEKLCRVHQAHPKETVCYRGHMLRKAGGDALFMPYNEMLNMPVKGRLAPSFALLPTGVSGVLYPPGAFDSVFFDKERFRALSLNADDIWYRAMTIRTGAKAVRVTPRNLHFLLVPASQKVTLMAHNIDGRNNDDCLRKVFTAFPEAYARIESAEEITRQ